MTVWPAVDHPPDLLKMLSHDLRWQLLGALAQSDRRVSELVDIVGRPANLVSYHLRQMWQRGLVQEHRSAADGRDIYYSLDLERLRGLYLAAGDALHPAFGTQRDSKGATRSEEVQPSVRLLFLCTHNSARSQMAEAIANRSGKGRVNAFSAGTEPATLNPYAARVIDGLGGDSKQHRAKHLDGFGSESFDYVITVCDRAREACPVFPGDPHQIHWSFPDPSEAAGSASEIQQAFNETARQLTTRINHLLVLIDRKQRDATPENDR